MRIGRQIEPHRSPLDARQRDQLNRVKADGAQMDGLGHGTADNIFGHCLEQPQHLDELALALVAHPRLKQIAQMLEHLRQVPVLQGRRLVERVRLHLDQRQVMQRIGDKGAFGIGARMPRHDLAGARRQRVIVATNRTSAVDDTRAARFSPIRRRRRQRAQRRRIGDKPFADRLGMAASALGLALPALRLEPGVELIKARRLADRHHEVQLRMLDQPLDVAPVVPLARTPEAVGE